MITFQKGAGDHLLTYPCRYSDVPSEIGVVNPCDGQHRGVRPPHKLCSDEYAEEAEMLVRVALDVERDIWPEYYFDFCGVDSELSPVLRSVGLHENDPKGCANAVRMDQPGELWQAIVDYSAREGIPVAPEQKGIRFLDRYVNPNKPFSDNLVERMKQAFEVKYFYGLARPEEYFNAANFAHYPEGCPAHPSYVAGHGCVGGVANRTFREEFPHATGRQRDAVETATLQFAHFRDLARVHTRQDSYEGWKLGDR